MSFSIGPSFVERVEGATYYLPTIFSGEDDGVDYAAENIGGPV